MLLNTTSGEQPEKAATPNLTLRGFDFIDRVKRLVEAECPGIVSCADILTLVARDSIVATVCNSKTKQKNLCSNTIHYSRNKNKFSFQCWQGGPFWRVPTGRRDGLISRSSEALSNVPSPMINFTTLQTLFANQGLDLKDLVLLSGTSHLTFSLRDAFLQRWIMDHLIKLIFPGAHTIGIAHCQSFSNRLYNFTGTGDEDPALDSEYAANLKARKCRSISDNTTIVEMDPGSRKTFDLSYYKLLLKRRGLFQSDAALTTNSNTLSMIRQILQGSIDFRSEFSKSMEKMGRIRVKTGSNGEIRRQCALVNS